MTQDAIFLGLFITAGSIIVGRDWRWLILALLGQYVLMGFALAEVVRPDIATLKVMIGAFICPILFLSARQVSSEPGMSLQIRQAASGVQQWWRQRYVIIALKNNDPDSPPTSLVFRGLLVLLMFLIAYTLSGNFPLPGLMASANTAAYWLILAGLVTLSLTEAPIKVGLGLFTMLTGFEFFYVTVEDSLLLTGLWGAINLLIALVIGYLTIVHGTRPEEDR